MFSHQNPIFYSSMSLRMPDPAASQSLLGCKGHHLNAGVGPDGKSDPIFLSRGKINSYWHCACGQKNQDTQIPPDPPSSQLGNSFIPIMLPTCITSLTISAAFQRGKVKSSQDAIWILLIPKQTVPGQSPQLWISCSCTSIPRPQPQERTGRTLAVVFTLQSWWAAPN